MKSPVNGTAVANGVNGHTYKVPHGMPLSVFTDRYSRKKGTGEYQSYEERIREVVDGNFSIIADPSSLVSDASYNKTMELALKGVLPFSGRHMQHGDLTQSERSMEVFTNCSTACFSFMLFYLLLNGSGVGRDYSSESCRVNWDFMPNFRVVLNGGSANDGDVAKGSHPDFYKAMKEFDATFEALRDAKHKYDSDSEEVRWIKVRDSREGWAEVLAILETAAFHKNHKDDLFIFDFSEVREEGAEIKGMQDRPAQGPIPLMRALCKVATVKGAGMKPWKQALFIDHYVASCVVMGNVRRAARMSTKYWKDRDVIEFIDIKRGGFLWSSNNSITVDEEFWREANDPRPSHARRVFEAAVGAAYFDQTGEPGFINVDKLNQNRTGMENITASNFICSSMKSGKHLQLHRRTYEMIDNVLEVMKSKVYPFITNPCGEIALAVYGGYCIIGNICLAHCDTLQEARDAAAMLPQFLIRVNMMDAIYKSEVIRTNRIGVGITGIHEFAWKHFNANFHNLIEGKATKFWSFIRELRTIAETSAAAYAENNNMEVPHTVTMVAPNGTISKVMNCTEGGHLPSVLHQMRWVTFPKSGPKWKEYESKGYPVKDISHQYQGAVVVGFPRRQPILDIMPAEVTRTANGVSISDHFKWLELLEASWIGSSGENNQISYTINYNPKEVNFNEFMDMILKYQPRVKCCTVMPVGETSAYAYIPEEPISEEHYWEVKNRIEAVEREAYNESELLCEGGVCPIEKNMNGVSEIAPPPMTSERLLMPN